MKKIALRFLTGVILFLLVLSALYWLGFVQLNNPSTRSYPVRGIDVSRHQGFIDWSRVAADSNVRFAYIKASEGADLRDPRFNENWEGARGMARGAYHFFTFCSDGKAQARNFLATAPRDMELPAAVDVEFGGNCKSWQSIENVRIQLSEFLSEIERSYSRRPVIYINRKSFGRIVRGHFDSRPLWVRETVVHPPKDLYRNWLFWQYAGNGRLPGVRTRIDLNVFAGDDKEFESLVGADG